MPNRIIREAILTSERIEQLDWQEEVFYRRLMNKVDDYGLFDARLSILRSSLYPLRVDRVREADIARWIAACETAGVIALYEHGGKLFLQMLDTGWQTRSEAKCPLPTAEGSKQVHASANTCAQPKPTAPVFVVGVGDVGGARKKRAIPLPEGFSVSERVRAWAAQKGLNHLDEQLEALVSYAKRKGATYVDWDEALMTAIREDWAKVHKGQPKTDIFEGAR